MKKNVASQVIGVQMTTAADGTDFTGTVTALITGDGGTQSASGGTGPTHEGNGFHTYLPTQAETNFDHIGFTFTGSGAISATIQLYTEFPQTGDSFARLGAPAGASVSADILVIDNFVDGLETTIGAAGAGLTALATPTNITAATGVVLSGVTHAGAVIPTVTTLTTKTGFSLSTAGILAIWHQALSAIVTAGSVGKLIKDEITAARMATLTDWINGGRLDLLLDAIPTVMRGTDSAALATSLATAQLDLDTITGTDGATLATAQALYAPAKAGDNMGTVSSVTGNVDGNVTGSVGRPRGTG